MRREGDAHAASGGVRPRRLEDVVLREIAGEVFLVPIRGQLADLQELFVLNPVGEWIWQHLDGASTLDELAEGVRARFAVSPDEARTDLRDFVGELAEACLLEPEPGPAAAPVHGETP